jgi:polyhydroxybutyrate depolymerase
MLQRLLLALLLAMLAPNAASACGPSEPCRLAAGGEYLVRPPPGWDGVSRIGAFVFIHGHRSSAADMMAYDELVRAVHALGFMLVAPQGVMESWSTPGSPGDGRRDEAAYLAALLDDLARRFPIDPKRLVASGFSQGASLVWEIACRGNGRFAAFLPVAGVWWRPMPTECPAPPRPLLHIHGTADPVMPIGGRQLRDRWRQGDVNEAIATIRKVNGCRAGALVREQRGALACAFERSCSSGRPIAHCLHEGDHHIDPSWFLTLRDWLEAALSR